MFLGHDVCVTICTEIDAKYNSDEFSPRDGKIVKAADELSALIEAYTAIENGCLNEDLQSARWNIRKKYEFFMDISNLNLSEIFAEF